MAISVSCPNCQHHSNAPDAAQGKRVRCSNCRTVFAISSSTANHLGSNEQSSNTSENERIGKAKIGRWIIAAIGVMATISIAVVVVNLVKQDSWERTVSADIAAICTQFERAYSSRDDSGTADAYAKLDGLVGDRSISLSWLADRVAIIRGQYPEVQQRISEKEAKLAEIAEAARLEEEARRQAQIAERERAKELERQKLAELKDLKTRAGSFAVSEIRDSLKAPSTAKFVNCNVYYDDELDVFFIAVTVDAQNSFGAMLRENHERYLKHTNLGWRDVSDKLSIDAKTQVQGTVNLARLRSQEIRLKKLRKQLDESDKRWSEIRKRFSAPAP